MKQKDKKFFPDKADCCQHKFSSVSAIVRDENNFRDSKNLLLEFGDNLCIYSILSQNPVDIFNANLTHKFIDMIAHSNIYNILINCEALNTLNSTGLKFLIKLIKYSKKQVVLFEVNKNIEALLDLCGISKLITIHDNKQVLPYFH